MNFIERLEKSLIPDYYEESLEVEGPIQMLLLKKKNIARYVLVVKSIPQTEDLDREITKIRNEVRKLTNALWMIKEVGVYVVFRLEVLPNIAPKNLNIDRTGFHAVIIQGIHLISDSGEHLFNYSKWLHHSFGGTAGIAEMIESIET